MKRLILVVASCFVVACGGGGGGGGGSNSGGNNPITPTPANHNPSITAMSFSPAFGIQELTSFTYSASASDSDGDSLSYAWDIAGNPHSGTSGTIRFTNGGSGTARLTVTDGKGGSASDTRSFVVGSATGTWVRASGPSALGNYRFVLHQISTSVTGTYWDSTYGDGRIDPAEPGTIDSRGNIRIRVKQGHYTDWYFSGTMAATGRTISGTVRGSGFTGQPFSVTKQ